MRATASMTRGGVPGGGRLPARLASRFQAPCVFVVAPGGAGKTTLLHHIAASAEHALSLSLGVEDRGFLHHIRRTVADRMKKDLGVAPWIVEAILGHAQPVLIETYMPSSPLTLMHEALERWSDALAALLRCEKADARSGKRRGRSKRA